MGSLVYPGWTMSIVPAESLHDNPLLRRVWEGLGRPSGYLAGGFLRDHLLGRYSTDLDFTLEGSVDDAAGPAGRLGEALGVRAHLIGQPPRCVWRIESDDLKVELWPLGSLSLDDDILRRDFKCNALAWHMPDGPLIDKVGGLEDIRCGRLTAVARGNLQDDPVRLLRGPRFVAQLEAFSIEHQTAHWIRELAPRLSYAPRARVGQELLQTLQGPAAEQGIHSILNLGLLRFAAPPECALDTDWLHVNAGACTRLACAEDHPVPASLSTAGDSARLVPLMMAWGRPSDASLTDYGWPRHQRKNAARAASMLKQATDAAESGPADRREIIHKAGNAFPALVAAAAAIHDPGPSSIEHWRRWWAQWTRHGSDLVRPTPLLEAHEVAAILDCGEGPELGAAISALTTAQVRGEVRTAGGARRWLRQHLQLHDTNSAG